MPSEWPKHNVTAQNARNTPTACQEKYATPPTSQPNHMPRYHAVFSGRQRSRPAQGSQRTLPSMRSLR